MSDDSALILEQFLAIRADLAAIRDGNVGINASLDRIEAEIAAIQADRAARRAVRDRAHEQATGL